MNIEGLYNDNITIMSYRVFNFLITQSVSQKMVTIRFILIINYY